MARQKGIIKLEGTIDGINFYYRKGVAVARAAGGGFTAKAIKHSPNMVRVRESNSEFANCSKVNKVFKQAIRPLTQGYVDGTLHSRLMQLFLKLKDADLVSKRGQRVVWKGLQSTIGKALLLDFNFTPKRPRLLPGNSSFNWTTLTYDITSIESNQLAFPANADYMEVILGVVRFDFEQLGYTLILSMPLVVERDFEGSDFSLSVADLPEGTGLAFAMVRVVFYQVVSGQPYLLESDGAFGLEVVGVEV